MRYLLSSKTAVLVIILLATSLGGCMKTRSQLRNEGASAESSVESGDSGTPPKQSGYQIEEMKAELLRLTGKVEEMEHTQKTQNHNALAENVSKLNDQVADLEKNQVLIMAELKDLKDLQSAKAAEEDEKSNIKSKPKDSLAHGFKLLQDEKYQEAADLFKKAVAAGLAKKERAEAHFGLGQALYSLEDYKKAIVELSKVQETNGKSARIPQALLLIGRSFEKLNMKKESQGFFQELQEKYPDSPEAKKAAAPKAKSSPKKSKH